MKTDILIAIMAVQEVVFFTPIAKRLQEELGIKVAFLTFHEAGDDILEKEGIPYLSLHKIKRSSRRTGASAYEVEKNLGTDIARLIFHEKHVSNRDEASLVSKVTSYYSIFNEILRGNEIKCVVQELGGFIAPLTMYYVSRENNIDHVFIEPAMFRKRVVFTLNDLYADIPNQIEKDAAMNGELEGLLNEYMTQKTVVIPKKDKHFFQDMTFSRLFSSDNFRRLSRKLYHKYVLLREEEYNWIWRYITMHVVKAFRRKLLSSYYSYPQEGEIYVYYPFHVPLDVQLTARCPEFFDQETLVSKIADSLPPGFMLYIKEHPAAIGGHSFSRLRKLLLSHDNVRLIHPGSNSFDVIHFSEAVITVNSKVGFEAIMQGKPVIVLGRTFYRGKGLTFDADNLDNLRKIIQDALGSVTNEEKRDALLNKAFAWSFKGELYENSSENVDNFYRSLRRFLKDSVLQNEAPARSQRSAV